MAVTAKDKETLSEEDLAAVKANTDAWEWADFIGDEGAKAEAAAGNKTIRNNNGYDSDDTGAYIAPQGTMVDKTGTYATNTNNASKNGGYTVSPEIDAMMKAKKDAAIADLKKAINNKVYGYKEQIAGLDGQYNPLRAQSETDRYKSARALKENLANSGEITGGMGRQDTLNLQNAYNANIGNIDRQQQSQTDSFNRAIMETQADGELDLAKLASVYDAEGLSAQLQDRYRWQDNEYRDKVFNRDNYESDREYNYRDERDEINDSRYEDETKYNREQDAFNNKLAEAGLTGWYKGQPTTTQQQIDIEYGKFLHGKEEDKKSAAMNLINIGICDEEIAAAAGISFDDANRLATIARKTQDNELTMQDQTIDMNQKELDNYGKPTGGKGSGSGGKGSGSSGKPSLTASQVKTALNDGNRSDAVLDAYEYYYGEEYTTGNEMNDSQFGQFRYDCMAIRDPESRITKVEEAYNAGRLTRSQANKLLEEFNKYA